MQESGITHCLSINLSICSLMVSFLRYGPNRALPSGTQYSSVSVDRQSRGAKHGQPGVLESLSKIQPYYKQLGDGMEKSAVVP